MPSSQFTFHTTLTLSETEASEYWTEYDLGGHSGEWEEFDVSVTADIERTNGEWEITDILDVRRLDAMPFPKQMWIQRFHTSLVQAAQNHFEGQCDDD